jgi:hypothetical protein
MDFVQTLEYPGEHISYFLPLGSELRLCLPKENIVALCAPYFSLLPANILNPSERTLEVF